LTSTPRGLSATRAGDALRCIGKDLEQPARYITEREDAETWRKMNLDPDSGRLALVDDSQRIFLVCAWCWGLWEYHGAGPCAGGNKQERDQRSDYLWCISSWET